MKKNFRVWLLHCKKKKQSEMWLRVRLMLLLLMTGGLFAEAQAQTERVTLKRDNASFLDIILAVENQTKTTFVYSMDAVERIGKISIDVQSVAVDSVMRVSLENSDYTYSREGNVIVIKRKEGQPALHRQIASRTLSGRVVDKKGEPLPGVSVRLDNTTSGTSTDAEGNFRVNVPEGDIRLHFSFIGMKTKVVDAGRQQNITVVLEEDISNLDEVTVVAYGERKKRELVSSISSVKAEDIDELPTASIENLLQGHMAGVEVLNVSGSPGGGGTMVTIRGHNSLLNNIRNSASASLYNDSSPLYVVDGVPIHSFVSPVTGTNTLAEIDPSTIESVEILKDAASAALYGSRAGNGVILITTKKGRLGKGKLTANASYSYSILPATPEQTGGHLERLANINLQRNYRAAYNERYTSIYKIPESYREAYQTNGAYDYFWNNGMINPNRVIQRELQDSLNPFYNNSTNWWKYAFRAGKILNANIQVNGGTETIRYMLGAGWYQERGIMHASDFTRANIISNLNIIPRKNLSIDSRIYLAYTDRSRGAGSTSFGASNAIEGLTVDPKSTSTLYPATGSIVDKVLEELNTVTEKNFSYRIQGSLRLMYEFFSGFSFSTSVAIDHSLGKSNTFRPSTLDAANGLSRSQGAMSSGTMLSNENILNYTATFRDRHNLDLMLGAGYLRESSDYMSGMGEGSPSDKIHYVPIGFPTIREEYGSYKAMQAYRSDFQEKVMVSYFGRAVYNYDKKYLVEYTLRRDGSSVFGENVRWATFPSLAVGWAFSEEPFMKNLWWLSFGKLRASWGTSGQQFGDPYLAHGLMEFSGTFLGNSGIVPSELLNRELTWEESDQYDIGLDLDLMDYRLKLKLDYYYKYSKSLLFNVSLPGNFNYHTSAWQNAMEISNQGIELELHYDIFRDTEVKWFGKLNASRNWNRFEKSYTDMDMQNNTQRLVIGRPIHGFYVYKDLGIIQSQEDVPVYYDTNGNKSYLYSLSRFYPYTVGARLIQDMDMDGVINDNDRYYAGSMLPLAHGGWFNQVSWKGFDMNVLFTYSLGRKIMNLYKISSLQFNRRVHTIFGDYADVQFWQQPGDQTEYPAATLTGTSYQGQFGGDVDTNVETVHYVRLKQLTLGYNLPKTWMKEAGIDGVRLFFTAENLFLLSNYSGVDPEAVSPLNAYDSFSNYPLARKMTLGLTLKF